MWIAHDSDRIVDSLGDGLENNHSDDNTDVKIASGEISRIIL